MTTKSTPLVRKAFGEQITDLLRDAIVRGELTAGQRLTEGELAERFDVSRGPIRDALRQLAGERLVKLGRSGSTVIGINEQDIAELYLLRQAIETLAATLLVERATPEAWRKLAHAVDEIRRAADAGDKVAFGAADIRFHSLIYELSGHRRLRDVWSQYAPILSGLLQQTIFERQDLHSTAERHQLLLDLLKSGDREALEAELRAHLEESHSKMLSALHHRDLVHG